MNKFKWMPILKTGTFTAKNGKKVTFDEEKLDQIVTNTDLTKEPQFVVEHPSYDKLGFGTISELKRVGNYLFALPKKVEEKFKEVVNSGELPGRSVSIDEKTFALSSIGFLPKEIAPAVDGLGSYAFSSENTSAKLQFTFQNSESHFAEIENDKVEFSEFEISRWPFQNIKNMFRSLKNAWIEKFGKEEADKTFPEWDLEETGNAPSVFEKNEAQINGIMQTSFSQNKDGDTMKIDLSKLDPQLKAAVEALEAELTTTRTELQSAKTTLSAAELERNRNEVLAFCESPEMKVKILPAEKEKVVGLLLAVKEKGTLEFSTADKTKVQFSAFDFLKETLKQMPDKIELSEVATKQNAGEDNRSEAQKVGAEMANFVNPKK